MAEGLLTIGGAISGQGLAYGMNKLMDGGSGGGQSVGSQIEDEINKMNKKLTTSLNNALNYSQNYTNQAVGTQQQYLGQGTNALNNALNTTTNNTQNSLFQGFNQSQALQSPYALMGYNAADAYMDSLGLARPKNGSANMAQMMNSAASAVNPGLIQQVQQAGKAAGQNPWATPTAPTAPTMAAPDINTLINALDPTQQALYNNWAINAYEANPKAAAMANGLARGQGMSLAQFQQATLQQEALKNQLNAQLAQQQQAYGNAQTQYNTQNTDYNNLLNAQQSLLGSTNTLSPDQLKTALAYRSGTFNTPQVI